MSGGRFFAAALALVAALAALALASLGSPEPVRADEAEDCNGEQNASGVEQLPGRRLRFGVTPSGAAGQVGLPSTFVPDRPRKINEALRKLRPDRGPFVTHAYTSWENAGRDERRRLRKLIDRYTRQGYRMDLVLRYKPSPEQEGKIKRWRRYVRRMVRAFARNPRVRSFQITNEVNFSVSPDSSDGSFEGAREALIRGIIAADAEARRRGHDQLEVGFNWIYRLDPGSESDFWEYLRDQAPPRFRRALDWLGLDAYPGTFFPPTLPPDGFPGSARNSIVSALDTLRCMADVARISEEVPIHVQENGYPTGPGRSEERQAELVEIFVEAFHDFRGTYNVREYKFFNLRDAETGSPNFQQHYGLMEDDYTPKPAFSVYEELIEKRTIRRRR